MIAVIHFGSSKSTLILDKTQLYSQAILVDFATIDQFNPAEYTGILFSGAPILITEHDISRQLEFVRTCMEAKVPLLGICFGHQLIGLNAGAQGYRQEEDRSMTEITLHVMDNRLTNGFDEKVLFSEDHCEAITLPEQFVLIASSSKCKNEWMMHTTHPWFGVQFHPETSGKEGDLLFKNFITFCKSFK